MQKAADILDELGIAYEVTVSSAHRNPDRTAEYARTAVQRLEQIKARLVGTVLTNAQIGAGFQGYY